MPPENPLVLIADDDPAILRLLAARIQSMGYRPFCASNKSELMKSLQDQTPDAMLLDLFFGDHNGQEILTEVIRNHPDLPILFVTGNGSIESAVAAIRAGAFDFLVKPVDVNRLKLSLEHALERRNMKRRLEKLEKVVAGDFGASRPMWGNSAPMEQVRELIGTVASTDATVLILGESGTGKEVVARRIHESSPRKDGPFIPVNMAALPAELVESTLFGHEKGAFTSADSAQKGCCEAADGGTLFLDEIGEMPILLQPKLLRFLQEHTIQRVGSNKHKKVDVRIVTATNRDLTSRVKDGEFREDLFYRLNVFPIEIPPLRERPEDILLLAGRFLERFSLRYRKDILGFSTDVETILQLHNWPGNVRELENFIERQVLLCKGNLIEATGFPKAMRDLLVEGAPGENPLAGGIPVPVAPKRPVLREATPTISPAPGEVPPKDPPTGSLMVEDLEKKAILDALERARGNVREAAALLGLGHATVYRRIKTYGIVLSDKGRTPTLGGS